MRRRTMIVGLVLSLMSAALYAQLRDLSPPPVAGTFRVTPWPVNSGPDRKYEQSLEDHLNKMAADGWRYHSELGGQNVKMMLFEKSPGR